MNAKIQLAVPSFEEAMPLSKADAPFIRELHELLKRHGNINRFGICLLHDHFAIDSDEILIESNDPHTRTLQMEVVKRIDLPKVKFTSWRIGGPNGKSLAGTLPKDSDTARTEALTACGPTCPIKIKTLASNTKTEALTA